MQPYLSLCVPVFFRWYYMLCDQQSIICFAILQVVPHITDALQDWIVDVSKKPVDDSDQEVR